MVSLFKKQARTKPCKDEVTVDYIELEKFSSQMQTIRRRGILHLHVWLLYALGITLQSLGKHVPFFWRIGHRCPIYDPDCKARKLFAELYCDKKFMRDRMHEKRKELMAISTTPKELVFKNQVQIWCRIWNQAPKGQVQCMGLLTSKEFEEWF